MLVGSEDVAAPLTKNACREISSVQFGMHGISAVSIFPQFFLLATIELCNEVMHGFNGGSRTEFKEVLRSGFHNTYTLHPRRNPVNCTHPHRQILDEYATMTPMQNTVLANNSAKAREGERPIRGFTRKSITADELPTLDHILSAAYQQDNKPEGATKFP